MCTACSITTMSLPSPLPPFLPPSLRPHSLPPSLPAGVDVSRSMVASCGSGVTAAHIALAAHTLGTQITVYDVRTTTISIYINTLFRCALTCREVGKGLCNHGLSKSKHDGQHLKQYYKDRGFRATYLESVSTVQFSCYLHHMESLKTKSRLTRSRAELAMRNGQCILCNMCVLFAHIRSLSPYIEELLRRPTSCA